MSKSKVQKWFFPVLLWKCMIRLESKVWLPPEWGVRFPGACWRCFLHRVWCLEEELPRVRISFSPRCAEWWFHKEGACIASALQVLEPRLNARFQLRFIMVHGARDALGQYRHACLDLGFYLIFCFWNKWIVCFSFNLRFVLMIFTLFRKCFFMENSWKNGGMTQRAVHFKKYLEMPLELCNCFVLSR